MLDNLPYSHFESIQQKTIRGTPDILGCINGVFVALELKAHLGAAISPMQQHKLSSIVKAGGYAYIICPENWEEIYQKLKLLSEQKINA